MFIPFLQALLSHFLVSFSVGFPIFLNIFLRFEFAAIKYHNWGDIVFDEQINFIYELCDNFFEPLSLGQVLRAKHSGLMEPAVSVNRTLLVPKMF